MFTISVMNGLLVNYKQKQSIHTFQYDLLLLPLNHLAIVERKII